MSSPAIFIDKDGTLVEDVPYNVDPARLRLMPGADAGLRALARSPYRLFIVTNQPGLALGRFDAAAFANVTASLINLFAERGCRLSGVYACPHLPVELDIAGCDCRKPQPGLLTRAAADHDLDLSRSWMIGDILNDVEAGRRAGCRTAFVDRGNESEWRWSRWRRPNVVAARFDRAVAAILESVEVRDAVLV